MLAPDSQHGFYAMFCLLRQKLALLATVHSANYRALSLSSRAQRATKDVMEERYYKAMYALMRAVYSALVALRYSDSNTPAMDKIFFLAHRTTVAIETSVEVLNDTALFGELGALEELDFEDEVEQVFGKDDAG